MKTKMMTSSGIHTMRQPNHAYHLPANSDASCQDFNNRFGTTR